MEGTGEALGLAGHIEWRGSPNTMFDGTSMTAWDSRKALSWSRLMYEGLVEVRRGEGE
jgi:hypothetical protein